MIATVRQPFAPREDTRLTVPPVTATEAMIAKMKRKVPRETRSESLLVISAESVA